MRRTSPNFGNELELVSTRTKNEFAIPFVTRSCVTLLMCLNVRGKQRCKLKHKSFSGRNGQLMSYLVVKLFTVPVLLFTQELFNSLTYRNNNGYYTVLQSFLLNQQHQRGILLSLGLKCPLHVWCTYL